MKMDSAALYQQLGNLMATIPEFSGDGWRRPEACMIAFS
jgi:hypothetical protein